MFLSIHFPFTLSFCTIRYTLIPRVGIYFVLWVRQDARMLRYPSISREKIYFAFAIFECVQRESVIEFVCDILDDTHAHASDSTTHILFCTEELST